VSEAAPLDAGSALPHYTEIPDHTHFVGFRVAMIPEPSTTLRLASGFAVLALGRRR
jgi:hypothetical protein